MGHPVTNRLYLFLAGYDSVVLAEENGDNSFDRLAMIRRFNTGADMITVGSAVLEK
jgi:hypothetical protein